MTSKTIQQGAEAIISLNEKDQIEKNRLSKSYRLPLLDKKIRKQRTKSEAKILRKSASLIPVPKLIKTSESDLIMEHIEGKKLSEHLDSLPNASSVCKTIGKQIALLHDAGIIHGDLTTSNMILQSKTNKLYFIDFGLSFISRKEEDKAVDLHLIKQALEAKHFKHFEQFFSEVLEGYKSTSSAPEKVLKRLEKVELRGRYKKQY